MRPNIIFYIVIVSFAVLVTYSQSNSYGQVNSTMPINGTSNSTQLGPSAPQPPSSPTGLTVIVISQVQIDLSWQAPTNNGGSSIVGYKIERSVNNEPFSDLVTNTYSTQTKYSDTGLVTNTAYKYRVSAINIVGISNPSNESSNSTKSPSPASTEYYTDTVDQYGITHRTFHDKYPQPMHSDVAKEQVDAMDLNKTQQLDDIIQSLPDSNFTNSLPVNVSKAILHYNVTSVGQMIVSERYHFANKTLWYIRDKMDGSIGGNPSDDLIVDTRAQKTILPLVNDLIYIVNLDSHPSYGQSKEVLFPPVIRGNNNAMPFVDPIVWYALAVLITINAVLGGIFVYQIKKKIP